MNTDRIERETLINATLDRVWEVLTHPGLWVGEGDPSNLDIRPGALIVFEMGSTKMPQLVEKFEPKTYFSYRWAAAPWRGQEPTKATPPWSNSSSPASPAAPASASSRAASTAFDTAEDLRLKALEDNSKGWSYSVEDIKQRAEAPAA